MAGNQIWQFGSMPFNCQIKIHQIFFHVHVRMAIPYHTAKFKSANNVVWGKTAKFNDDHIFPAIWYFLPLSLPPPENLDLNLFLPPPPPPLSLSFSLPPCSTYLSYCLVNLHGFLWYLSPHSILHVNNMIVKCLISQAKFLPSLCNVMCMVMCTIMRLHATIKNMTGKF